MSDSDNTATQQLPSTTSKDVKVRRRTSKNVETPAEKKPTHIEVAPREYDLDLIDEFLGVVFHTMAEGDKDEILTWAVEPKHKPIYPMSDGDLFDLLENTRNGKALYFGTATCRPDNAGKLFNRQALFERLHVIVLDDIGTKGDITELPEELKPTYIIESSKGNYQYGYVLETPIDNLDAAKALVKIMYEAGIADAGGKMPNKLVRLPEGINGKEGVKRNFITKLLSMDGPLWTPQGLLDALDCGATWSEIEEDAHEATKRRTRLKGGSTPWAPYRPTLESIGGVIDPVAEWLGDPNNEYADIIQDNGEWLTVTCPWEHEHTTGDGTAGYKPLGRGDNPTQRVFHCFHDSCASQRTNDFLQHVASLGGPTAGAQDHAAEMVSAYVYDTINDCAWKIKDTTEPKQITMSGLRNTHPRKTLVSAADGKLKSVAEYQQWLTSESRVTVMGPTFDPSTPARIVEREGDLFVNQFSPPSWGDGPYAEKDVDEFKRFMDYLIPAEAEREYFLDWLAAKVQNMGFRGAAIVMVAQTQGVGRSTLADMIATLIGDVNLRNEPFEKIVGEVQYNDWLEAPFVVTDETLNSGGLNSYKTYEKLKELIDPRPRLMSINPKYGKQRRSMVHSSFLFLSNHSNALSISEDDRRFYVVSNPHKPAPPTFFAGLNKWLSVMDENGKPAWATNIYRWLLARKVDMPMLLSPPEATAAKKAMIEESRSDLDMVAREIVAKWPCEYISASQFTHAIEHFADRLGLYDIGNYKAQIKRMFGAATYALGQGSTVKLDNKTTRFKVIIAKATDESTPKGENLSGEDRAVIRGALVPENIAKAMANIAEALDVAGL